MPKHGSWLNVAEVGLSVSTGRCPDRRTPDRQTLCAEARRWYRERNAKQRWVQPQSSILDGCGELHRPHPQLRTV